MQVFPVVRELSPEMLEGIGAVCFEWALLERELSLVTYMLLRLGSKQGRVAVRSPRANDSLTMIRQLMSLENLSVKDVDLDQLAKSLIALEKLRDQIAHGIFLRGENEKVFLQSLSGNWKPDPKQPKVARRIKPEGIGIASQDFKHMAKLIAVCTGAIHQMGLELERGRGPSQKKFQQQSDQDRPLDDPNSDTNESRPQPSSG